MIAWIGDLTRRLICRMWGHSPGSAIWVGGNGIAEATCGCCGIEIVSYDYEARIRDQREAA